VETRQQLMKDVGGNTRVITGYVKGENDATPAQVKERALAIAALMADVPDKFGDQIHTGNADGIKTRALPAIWERWDEFTKITVDLKMAAENLAQVADGGDKDAITAAFGDMTRNCGACHRPFRAEQN
jgi:cytochrome c556